MSSALLPLVPIYITNRVSHLTEFHHWALLYRQEREMVININGIKHMTYASANGESRKLDNVTGQSAASTPSEFDELVQFVKFKFVKLLLIKCLWINFCCVRSAKLLDIGC